jgi:hypothetical protein
MSIIVALISSCGLLSTREPETPDVLSSDYPPATSTDLLINNLINSFNNVDYTAYLNCFADKSKESLADFEFIPAGDAISNFPGLFLSWSISNETRNIKALFSAIDGSQNPLLSFSNAKYEIKTADSSVLSAGYYIRIKFKDKQLEDIYSGTLYFTFIAETNGLWKILRWTDINIKGDTVNNSWSMLKAKFSN